MQIILLFPMRSIVCLLFALAPWAVVQGVAVLDEQELIQTVQFSAFGHHLSDLGDFSSSSLMQVLDRPLSQGGKVIPSPFDFLTYTPER